MVLFLSDFVSLEVLLVFVSVALGLSVLGLVTVAFVSVAFVSVALGLSVLGLVTLVLSISGFFCLFDFLGRFSLSICSSTCLASGVFGNVRRNV